MAKLRRSPLFSALFEKIVALLIVVGGSWVFINERQTFYSVLVVTIIVAAVIYMLRPWKR